MPIQHIFHILLSATLGSSRLLGVFTLLNVFFCYVSSSISFWAFGFPLSILIDIVILFFLPPLLIHILSADKLLISLCPRSFYHSLSFSVPIYSLFLP